MFGTNFNAFLTWNTTDRSSPLQIGLRRRRRSRRRRRRWRWRRANFKFIHQNFPNNRLSFFKTPSRTELKVLRRRRPVKINLKVIKKPGRPISTTTAAAAVPQRFLPEIGIRTAAPAQPTDISIRRIHPISRNTPPWPINKIRNSTTDLSIVV